MAMESIDLLFGLLPLEADAGAIGAPFSHDRTLVGVSMLLAVLTAFAFLDLIDRARAHQGWSAKVWNAAAGAMFGACVWATHFVGLLAIESPLIHGVRLWPSLASALIGIAFGAVAFLFAGARLTWPRTLGAGVCVGLGGVVMHYLGMRGLDVEAALSYRLLPVVLTAGGACVASMAALWIAHRLQTWWQRAILALPMGAVTAGLHYTDIAATIITPRPEFTAPASDHPVFALTAGVVAGVVVASAAAVLAAALDRRSSGATALSDPDEHVVVIPGPEPADSDDVVVIPQRRPQPRE